MRPIWRGAISFGLVSIPVRLYSATESHDVSFRQVHAADGGRIRYRRVCEVDGAEVPYSDVAKGYELPDGDLVVLSADDLANLPLVTSRAIEVVRFVPSDQIDPLLFNRSYYAEPDKTAARPYVLLRDALAHGDRVALVKVALRNRESLAVLRSQGDVLVVHTLLWPEEVRDPATLAPSDDVRARDQEVAMAGSYIETLAGDFDPQDFTDDYRKAVDELIASKISGRELKPAPRAEGGEVLDLMAALRDSVREAKTRRSTAGGEDEDKSGGRGRRAPKKPASRGGGGRGSRAASGGGEDGERDEASTRRTGTSRGGRRRTDRSA